MNRSIGSNMRIEFPSIVRYDNEGGDYASKPHTCGGSATRLESGTCKSRYILESSFWASTIGKSF